MPLFCLIVCRVGQAARQYLPLSGIRDQGSGIRDQGSEKVTGGLSDASGHRGNVGARGFASFHGASRR
ncbi:MAG: hypothetical protein LBI62_03940 [Candidatus Accumulibacter sp.]|nr:hypothetical protein [Accumulibacter sp.]